MSFPCNYRMNGRILKSSKQEGRYYIVIHTDENKSFFNVCVYDNEKTESSWNDWIASKGADTEEQALEVYNKFIKEYYPDNIVEGR